MSTMQKSIEDTQTFVPVISVNATQTCHAINASLLSQSCIRRRQSFDTESSVTSTSALKK